MKKIFIPLLSALALTMASCSDDMLDKTGGKYDDGSYAYIRTTIALPTAGTRSQTDEDDGQTNSDGTSASDPENKPTDDFEYGYDFENDVRSVLLVIATENDEYITHLIITGLTNLSTSGQPYQFTADAKIPYATLEKAYGSDGAFKDASKSNRPNVRLYAFCNYTRDLYDQFEALEANSLDTEWVNFKGTVEENASQPGQKPTSTSSVWSPRSFLMSNYNVYTAEFPGDLDEWDPYADTGNPLVLTKVGYLDDPTTAVSKPINVERSAARIDFRDGSENGDYTYQIKMKIDNNPENDLSVFAVQLKRMALVNMSKEFYYLRRVSNDGLNTNSTLCGLETPRNYVVDTDAEAKNGGGMEASEAANYFNFPLFDETGAHYNNMGYSDGGRYGWYVNDIEDVLAGQTDLWSGSKDNRYHIWRYVTENTIPSINDQQVQQSTGVIFKAAIKLGDDVVGDGSGKGDKYVSEALITALNRANGVDGYEKAIKPSDLPAIYSFHNRLYAGVADIVDEALLDGDGGSLYTAVLDIIKNWYITGDSKVFTYSETAPANSVQLDLVIANQILNGLEPTDGSKDYRTGYTINFEDPDADAAYDGFDESRFIEMCPAQDITVFIPTDDDGEGLGYYCYYFYWNRHNDNLHNGKMGLMEFATVRNNVYKLAVTGITGMGHPRRTEDDPDPVEPHDPDEELMNSIQVEINVLPWVVRVNDIVF